MAEEITADTKKLENKKIDDAYITYYQEHNDRGIKADAKRLIIVILGALLIGFNMKVFLNQGELLPAGLNGIATLIQRLVKLCSGIANIPTIDSIGVVGGNIHSTGEWAELESLVSCAERIAIAAVEL